MSSEKTSDTESRPIQYRVAGLEGLTGRFSAMSRGEQLVSFGKEGCAFAFNKSTEDLTPPKRLVCEFEMEGVTEETLKIQGNVKEIKPIDVGDKEVSYIFVEFLENEREQVTPLVDKFKELGCEQV